MQHKALIVGFYGGPSSGKSTTATGVFSRLKIHGVNAEYVPEYVKDLVWADRKVDNQVLILGKQFDRIWRLRNKVDIIVTDAPILLTLLYNDQVESLNQVAKDLYGQFHNLDIFIRRVKPYNPAGRYQNEDGARQLDTRTLEMLSKAGVPYQEVNGDQNGIEEATKMALLALTLK